MTVALLTSSWRAMADRHATGDRTTVPVRISLGKPKFWPLAASFPKVDGLMPAGLLRLPESEFPAAYLERLDRIGVDAIASRLEAVHAEYGRPLALCCFEHDRADCHRGLFASWWEERTGQAVREAMPSAGHAPVPAPGHARSAIPTMGCTQLGLDLGGDR